MGVSSTISGTTSTSIFSAVCNTEADTVALGAQLAHLAVQDNTNSTANGISHTAALPFCIHLSGPVGAGKSCLCRAFLRALGVQGAIKSPSYALMEVYNLLNCLVYHFDLYRLSSPVELLEYGLLEPMQASTPATQTLCLVEWPEQAQGLLPTPDVHVQLQFGPAVQAQEAGLALKAGPDPQALPRMLVLEAHGARGQAVVAGCVAWAQANSPAFGP